MPETASSGVSIIEVGPRDGLQRIETIIPARLKADLIEDLVGAGLREIQITSFVHPQVVPQLADAEEVAARLPRREGSMYSALVLNPRGLKRALNAGLRAVETGIAASETFSQLNAGCSIADSLVRMRDMVVEARREGVHVRGGVQVAFGCAYEGDVPEDRVLALVEKVLAMEVDEISLSDTAGLGTPKQVGGIVRETVRMAGDVPVTLHLHDTRGFAQQNLLAALDEGVRRFDTAFGGLGGCPFIPAAKGNISTEETARLLEALGFTTGVDVGKVSAAYRKLKKFLKAEEFSTQSRQERGDAEGFEV